MIGKLLFYEHHGVEEYYDYDPEANTLEIYVRGLALLVREHDVAGHVSERLGIRFEMTEPKMKVYKPDGERFLYFEELQADRRRQELRADGEKRLRRRQTELSRKVRQGQATAEEQAELDRLEAEST